MKTLLAVVLVALSSVAFAHGDHDWIRKEGHTNAAGEQCCGEKDCTVIPPWRVTLTSAGYVIWPDKNGGTAESVPEAEAKFSKDGQFWRCAWGGKRKCFFVPKPSS